MTEGQENVNERVSNSKMEMKSKVQLVMVMPRSQNHVLFLINGLLGKEKAEIVFFYFNLEFPSKL